ncbi:hypothetical protein ACJVC5_15600 [Peredibacter sp. HCB2-198]|uniref:hypothetical protein n=1 Tax=Peredibacter sp. HCB2-198 TaxID=3383025 RepID=UPI0038B48F47
MAGNLLFYYFGDDEAYFKTLQGEMRLHCRLAYDLKKVYATDEKKIQSLFLTIYKTRPAGIFIDFSKNTQDYLHLARIIARTPLEHSMITVGLVDYLSPPEVLMESVATGVNLTHIKSAESFDVVFDVMSLISPGQMSHGFATAGLKEDLEAGIPVKIGYIHNEGIHFETDYKLTKGSKIVLNHHWAQKKTVPSKTVTINNITSMNLFYQFKYAVDAEFMFIDEFLPPEGMDEATIAEKKTEREDLIQYHHKLLSRWIDDNMSRSFEKRAKVLVVDGEFKFYQDQQRTDKHPYTIRCVPFLQDVGLELDRFQPQVIAFAIDKKEKDNPKNTQQALDHLVNAIKNKFSDISPFIIIFNSEFSSKQCQDNLQYANIMAVNGEMSVDLLVRMADIFEKKMASMPVTTPKKSERRVYIKKTNSASISEIMIPIKIVKLSESDMIFQTDIPLVVGSNLHLTTPVDMYVNVQLTKNQGKVPEYHGLIHCMGEDDKKELRRYVNSIFFRDHDAQVNAETEEFKKLNEAKLQEKLENESISAESKEPETEGET